MRLLLVEDERELAAWLIKALAQSGLVVDWIDDGRLVLPTLQSTGYDAMVLDLGLPGLDGHEVLAAVRAQDLRLPVLILTARDSLMERVSSLHEGADDFLAKPFEVAELEARLTALVRRARGSEHPRFACGPLAYEPSLRQFLLAGQGLTLTPREQAVLRVLIQHTGQPLSKGEILQRVFSDEHDVQPEAVEVLIYRLRKRLDGSAVHISTLRGLGYVLEHRP